MKNTKKVTTKSKESVPSRLLQGPVLLLNDFQKAVLKKAIIDDFKESIMQQGIIVTGTLIETKASKLADRIIKAVQDSITGTLINDKRNVK